VGKSSIATRVKPPREMLVHQADIEQAPAGSASRAFLSFWSTLQWQSWPEALTYYSPELRRSIGAPRLLEALKFEAATYRSNKPELQGESTRKGRTAVRFQLVSSAGDTSFSSKTWQRVGGEWTIVYDSNLDQALRNWAQNRTQLTTDPEAKTSSAAALRAGIEAGEAQSGYVDGARRASR
jgi:hypothetical protein